MSVAYLDHASASPAAVAHRGGAADKPENSWPAFEHAVSLGYSYLETDARTTSDGKVVAFHDSTLDRATDRTGRISKMTYREVSAARVHGTEEIPLLEDLLGTFTGQRFAIDLKDSGNVEPLNGILRRTGAWDRICITSLAGRRLLSAQRSLDKPVCLAVTPTAFVAVRYAGRPGMSLAAQLARAGARCAQVPGLIATRGFIRRCHELGLAVHVWTLNTRAEIERALDLGADGIMTDNVVLLKKILGERDQWHQRGNTAETGLDGPANGNLDRVPSVAM